MVLERTIMAMNLSPFFCLAKKFGNVAPCCFYQKLIFPQHIVAVYNPQKGAGTTIKPAWCEAAKSDEVAPYALY